MSFLPPAVAWTHSLIMKEGLLRRKVPFEHTTAAVHMQRSFNGICTGLSTGNFQKLTL